MGQYQVRGMLQGICVYKAYCVNTIYIIMEEKLGHMLL